MSTYVIGVDIGGMSIKWGLVNKKGQIMDTATIPTDRKEPQDAAMKRLGEAINAFVEKTGVPREEIKGIGIGIPGLINAKAGIVTSSANLTWKDLHIVEQLEEITGFKVKIGNDANVAALGEVKFGAAKGNDNMVMLTLGTGVGGGIIIDGKILEGAEGAGAELGHVSLNYGSHLVCGCGRKGCLEVYASASALIKQTKQEMMDNLSTSMWDLCNRDINRVTGKTAFDAYKAGDAGGEAVVNQYVRYLSEGILNLCNIFRPEVVVLSGGIAKEGKLLVDLVTAYCEKENYGYKGAPKTVIKIAELGYNTGVIGAASLWM